MTDPRDPLAGLDPYPRELIDTLGLHRERADLLEDIVSTPGPARPTTARTRALLAIGVAAAVAIIGGGWFLASGNGGHDETPVAAASATTATDPSTAPTTAPTSVTSGAPRVSRCERAVARNGELRRILPLLRHGELGKHRHPGRFYLRATREGRRYVVVVGRGCTIRALRSLSATRH